MHKQRRREKGRRLQAEKKRQSCKDTGVGTDQERFRPRPGERYRLRESLGLARTISYSYPRESSIKTRITRKPWRLSAVQTMKARHISYAEKDLKGKTLRKK